MNELQEIYTKIKNSTDMHYSESFKETSYHFAKLIENGNELSQDDLYILIGKQSNGIADAGQWGACSKEQFLKISEIWPDIYSILKNGKIRRLTADEYLKVRQMIHDACDKDKIIITNRIFAAFFPDDVSATCYEKDFYKVAKTLEEKYSDYPKITKNWLIDNYAFVDFCKNNLTEDGSLPIPVFSWKLRDAINDGILNKDTNMAKEKSIMNPYVTLLENNKNLILHGAPGTGKTYTAKDIAAQMICGKPFSQIEAGSEEEKLFNEQTEFVQFHPSYDYSDFVEGLRPIEGENTGDVGFERKDGVVKEFCERALKSGSVIQTNNFDDSWDDLIEYIRNEMSEGRLVKIGNWEYSVSKANSLKYQSVGTKSNYSFTITKENVYLAYQHKKGRPSGYFQKEMEDTVGFMKENFKLSPFSEDSTTPQKNSNLPYIFIIDEINRGEMSKIFGELFFSIDPDYRGTKGKVRTQYANMLNEQNNFDDALGITNSFGHFFVPENVYIIGTMNDIDRSVDSMDFAMRRRFTFVELKANEWLGMLDNLSLSEGISKSEIIAKMTALNEEIAKISGLSSAYHIGGSYFAKLSKYSDKSKNEAFVCLWNNHLKPLITDYLRGPPNLEKKIETFKEKYDKAGTETSEKSSD